MKSHEILKQVVDSVGTKQVAHDLGVSASLIYKWCAEPPAEVGEDGSGARNPLDRLVSLVKSTGDRTPVEWLCTRVGGYFVEAPDPTEPAPEADAIRQSLSLLAHFAGLLHVVSESISDDGRIDLKESQAIRAQLHKLQGRAESFVRACEEGSFDPERCPREPPGASPQTPPSSSSANG